MARLTVTTAHTTSAHAPSHASSAKAPDTIFSDLLGSLKNKSTFDTGVVAAGDNKKNKDKETEPDADLGSHDILQSLETALASLPGGPTQSPTPSPKGNNSAGTEAQTPRSSIGLAVSAATTEMIKGEWDVSGKIPLQTLLQSDPSIGMKDMKMKTFLAAANTTPMQAGGKVLSVNTSWSPLALTSSARTLPLDSSSSVQSQAVDLRKISSMETISQQTNASDVVLAQTPTVQAQVSQIALGVKPTLEENARVASRVTSTPEVTRPQTSVASSSYKPSVSIHLSPSQISSHVQGVSFMQDSFEKRSPYSDSSSTEKKYFTLEDDSSRSSAGPDVLQPVATTTIATDTNISPTLTSVPIGNLPAFIADQASTLSTATSTQSAPSTMTPQISQQAAQVVKELNIALDPEDLGAVTLKLRLAGGKLSVTIDVANSQTLSALEQDRTLITESLNQGGQSVDEIVIQQQAITKADTPTDTSITKYSDQDPAEDKPNSDDIPTHWSNSASGGRAGAFRAGFTV